MNANLMRKQHIINPQLNRLEIAHSALNRIGRPFTKYFIEDAEIKGNDVCVLFIDEAVLNAGAFADSDWKECVITLPNLKSFITARELNLFTINSSDHEGCHQQVSGCIPLDIYLNDNIHYAAGEYLQAGKEFSYVA